MAEHAKQKYGTSEYKIQVKFLEMKTITSEMKGILDGTDGRFNTTEEKQLANLKSQQQILSKIKHIEKRGWKENEQCVNEL